MSEQRCVGCGRETAAGSTLFAGRRQAKHRETGERVFVCASCADELHTGQERFTNARLGAFELSDMFRG